jgi:LPS-assembly lipoprotein
MTHQPKSLLSSRASAFARNPGPTEPLRRGSRIARRFAPLGRDDNRWVGFARLAVLAWALLLSACGFHPLYGNAGLNAGVGSTLANVYVEPIPERVGYELRNELLDLFNATGESSNAAFRLKLSVNESEEAVVLQTNTAITRYNYTLSAHYELIPRDGASAVKSGDVTALSAYNVAAAPFLYATVTAERDAKNRAANDIAERIRTQIAVYLRTANAAPR